MAMARCLSDQSAIRYILPVSWMTSCFKKVAGHLFIFVVVDNNYGSKLRTGAKSAMYDFPIVIIDVVVVIAERKFGNSDRQLRIIAQRCSGQYHDDSYTIE